MRGYTAYQIKLARDMLADGNGWGLVAKALGKRSPDGIRRRLDPEYHKRRNAYQAKYMREFSKRKRAST